MQLTTKTQRERERETRKRDANIEGTESAIFLGFSATLKYRHLARSGGCGGGFGGETVIGERPAGAFWGLKDRGSTAFFVDRHARR